MRHTVRLHGVIVGHSELEHVDPDVGRAWGEFRPGLGYELVQPVFLLFAQAVPRDGSPKDTALLDRYHQSRDALHLELQDDQSRTIKTSAIHIVDYSASGEQTTLELDVLISDDAYWKRRATSRVAAGQCADLAPWAPQCRAELHGAHHAKNLRARSYPVDRGERYRGSAITKRRRGARRSGTYAGGCASSFCHEHHRGRGAARSSTRASLRIPVRRERFHERKRLRNLGDLAVWVRRHAHVDGRLFLPVMPRL